MITITTGQELLSELKGHFTLVETGTDWPNLSDQRQAVRYEMQSGRVPVEISSRYGLTSRGLLADVSLIGARIIADYVPSSGEIVRLAFEIARDRFVLDGEVCHMGVEGSIRYFGVRFTE
jgi:hypothetical protein